MVGMNPRAGPQTEETEARTDPSCNTAAAIITFVVIPALLFAPVGVTYLFVGRWAASIGYVLLGILSVIAAGVGLFGLALAGGAVWFALGEPIAQACQTRKNRWQDRRQGRMPEAG